MGKFFRNENRMVRHQKKILSDFVNGNPIFVIFPAYSESGTIFDDNLFDFL